MPIKNIVHLADSTKIKIIAIKKTNSKLKIWSIKMPNAPYSNRSTVFQKRKSCENILF